MPEGKQSQSWELMDQHTYGMRRTAKYLKHYVFSKNCSFHKGATLLESL